MAKTVTTSTVVWRPFRLIGLICLVIALIFLIIGISSGYWSHTIGFHQGLWEACIDRNATVWKDLDGSMTQVVETTSMCASTSPKPAWLNACCVFMVGAMLIIVGAIVVVILSFLLDTVTDLGKIGGIIAIGALVCDLLALIIYPSVFTQILSQFVASVDWYFGWGYGISWGAGFFIFGASILLLCCRVNDEIYHAEKTYVIDT